MISLEYIAGVFDSRGQMIIQDDGFGRRIPVMEIRSDTPALLELVVEALGGHIVFYEKRGWYYWKRTSRPAQEALRKLRPYMIVRAAQVDRMLSIEIQGVGKYRRRTRPEASIAAQLQRAAA